MNHVSPLIPTTERPGYSVIATPTEMELGLNENKTVTPMLAALNYIGYYNPNRHYVLDQCVYFGGGFYTAIESVTGVEPPNPTYWVPTIQMDTSGLVLKDAGGGVQIGTNWSIRQVGTELHFMYDGVARFKSTNAGLITSVDDIRAFGAI